MRSPRLERVPLAVAADGHLYLNILQFDGVKGLADFISARAKAGDALFVGVRLRPGEVKRALELAESPLREVAALLVGRRQRPRRRR